MSSSTDPTTVRNPYDELPYKSLPIEWTAPERLALASLLYGGPRTRTQSCRVLELGCGDGANLLPLAHYRSGCSFVGIDGADSQIAIARRRQADLGLRNVEFIAAEFCAADARLEGEFDYIVAHGVFSWISDEARDALLRLCSRRLRDGGLLYLNYNTLPGWSVRGMVRDFLIAQTAGAGDLLARARQAQAVAAQMAGSFELPVQFSAQQPYSRLIANEFEFVCEHDTSYVAHEYLSPFNRAYWRSEFLGLARAHGLEYVADADFSHASGRLPPDLPSRLQSLRLTGRSVEDTVDLLCYRQLHSPILCRGGLTRRPPSSTEFGALSVASCLTLAAEDAAAPNSFFTHPPSGFQVETRTPAMRQSLLRLQPLWPRGLPVQTLFSEVAVAMDDLVLLHRNGLIELRLADPAETDGHPFASTPLPADDGAYAVTPYHSRVAIEA